MATISPNVKQGKTKQGRQNALSAEYSDCYIIKITVHKEETK